MLKWFKSCMNSFVFYWFCFLSFLTSLDMKVFFFGKTLGFIFLGFFSVELFFFWMLHCCGTFFCWFVLLHCWFVLELFFVGLFFYIVGLFWNFFFSGCYIVVELFFLVCSGCYIVVEFFFFNRIRMGMRIVMELNKIAI